MFSTFLSLPFFSFLFYWFPWHYSTGVENARKSVTASKPAWTWLTGFPLSYADNCMFSPVVLCFLLKLLLYVKMPPKPKKKKNTKLFVTQKQESWPDSCYRDIVFPIMLFMHKSFRSLAYHKVVNMNAKKKKHLDPEREEKSKTCSPSLAFCFGKKGEGKYLWFIKLWLSCSDNE